MPGASTGNLPVVTEVILELTGAYHLRHSSDRYVPGDDPLELRWPGPAAIAHGNAMARGQRWLDYLERQADAAKKK